MTILLREKRFMIFLAIIGCAFGLNLWLLGAIRTVDVEPPDPADIKGRGALASLGEDKGSDDTKDDDLVAEELAEQRNQLEQDKQAVRNRVERLQQRLTALASSLTELKAAEKIWEEAWTSLKSADTRGAKFTESMAQDYVALHRRRESISLHAHVLSERHLLLDAMLRRFKVGDMGVPLEELTPLVGGLNDNVEDLDRTYREITRQTERLAKRSQSGGSHGDPLNHAVARIASAEIAPELESLCSEREDALAAECSRYLQGLVEQTKNEAEENARQRRSSSDAEAEEIRDGAADSLAEHQAEQERLDRDVEVKQAAIAFERDRAKIEHYLVPFIALKRIYTTPAVMEDEIKEFAWADIPLEGAASLAEIKSTGVFEQGADQYKRLERFIATRLEKEIGQSMLPFGQHWSSRSEVYLIIARELLMKHGPMMVEKGLLRP